MNRIGDYGLIGDCHSVALVGRDGSIDWACFPRFDSSAVFAKILDLDKGGSFLLAGVGALECRRSYAGDSNVLVTTQVCPDGELEITDCMPTGRFDPAAPGKVECSHSILRRARVTRGKVEVELLLAPRFEYGHFTPRFTLTSPRTAEIVGGADALWVACSRELGATRDDIGARWQLAQGDEVWIETTWTSSHDAKPSGLAVRAEDFERRLNDTLAFWRDWIGNCWYQGEHEKNVRRSALALKALIYAPTGAVVAAPTTSLPEEIGGGRNWDYRYTWIETPR